MSRRLRLGWLSTHGHFLLCREDGRVDTLDGHRGQAALVDGLEGVLWKSRWYFQ